MVINIASISVVMLVVISPIIFMFFILPRLKPWGTMVREWKLTKIRKYALKYIDLLNRLMLSEKWPRAKKRQFWRQFVSDGRFIEE